MNLKYAPIFPGNFGNFFARLALGYWLEASLETDAGGRLVSPRGHRPVPTQAKQMALYWPLPTVRYIRRPIAIQRVTGALCVSHTFLLTYPSPPAEECCTLCTRHPRATMSSLVVAFHMPHSGRDASQPRTAGVNCVCQ